MTEAKIHPPSRSRIAEARASGVLPRPLLIGLSASLCALAALLRTFGATFADGLARLMRAPLEALTRGDSAAALSLASQALAPLARSVMLSLGAVAACVVVGSLLAQGAQLGFARGQRRRFSAPKLSFTASLLAIVGLTALCAGQLLDALWLEPREFPSFAARLLLQAAALFAALALIDAAFARAEFFRALFLTRRELREEQREAFGAPEVRAARARARRELDDLP
jgi:type III secretory pathway component EscU